MRVLGNQDISRPQPQFFASENDLTLIIWPATPKNKRGRVCCDLASPFDEPSCYAPVNRV